MMKKALQAELAYHLRQGKYVKKERLDRLIHDLGGIHKDTGFNRYILYKSLVDTNDSLLEYLCRKKIVITSKHLDEMEQMLPCSSSLDLTNLRRELVQRGKFTVRMASQNIHTVFYKVPDVAIKQILCYL